MEWGLLRDFWGIFPCEVKDIIFTGDEIEPTRGEIEKKIGKLGNSNFLFGWKGPLVMIFGGVGAGGPDWGGGNGVGGAMAGSQMGQGVEARSARWQGREGMAGGR